LEPDLLPSGLVVDPPMTDFEFGAFCLRNDNVQVERTAMLLPPRRRTLKSSTLNFAGI
jgi:hypothetical protein